MISQELIEEIKQRLLKEKEELEAKITKLKMPEEGMVNPQVDDIANDAEEDIYEEGMLHFYEKVLDKVNTALSRIEDGSYGTCIHCGGEIEERVLREVPWAQHCPKCSKGMHGEDNN